jgi:dynein heavy chain
MNPGYAGRQELPENLKVLFRSVSMMVPDRQTIMKVKLASVGYTFIDPLSKKFNILYKLCEEQLSKQRHYDFGLRNILSVLRTAGTSKRDDLSQDELFILARTLRDMNLSKFVFDDIQLFLSLLRDTFPTLYPTPKSDIPKKIYKEQEGAIKKIMRDLNLIDEPEWTNKIIQLYETSLVRHGFMCVGTAGSGKSTIMNCLTKSLTDLGLKHQLTRMNPKAIKNQEMYGMMNLVTNDWIPGVFSQIWKKCNSK